MDYGNSMEVNEIYKIHNDMNKELLENSDFEYLKKPLCALCKSYLLYANNYNVIDCYCGSMSLRVYNQASILIIRLNNIKLEFYMSSGKNKMIITRVEDDWNSRNRIVMNILPNLDISKLEDQIETAITFL